MFPGAMPNRTLEIRPFSLQLLAFAGFVNLAGCSSSEGTATPLEVGKGGQQNRGGVTGSNGGSGNTNGGTSAANGGTQNGAGGTASGGTAEGGTGNG
jgi:hypothetical protein